MGTNFFWLDSPCDHCGRYETIHVGKSSGGWTFSFRAYRHQLSDDEHPEWGYSHESPFGYPVLSRNDWRKVFDTRDGFLKNEYGTCILDPVKWVDALAGPTPEERYKEDQEIRRSIFQLPAHEEWRDAEGFRFKTVEFC
jgi:hypothetical protein